ncbi:MAG: hypothetical protein FWJ66_03480 [Caldibacillus sp.]
MKQVRSHHFRLEEMVQLLIRIVGHTNKKISELETRVKKLENDRLAKSE